MLDKDIRLRFLEELYLNSRVKDTELAKILSVSRQTISKLRIKYWKNRIIASPTLLLNPHVLNLQYFFMEIKTNPTEPQLLEQIRKMPQVVSIDGILGDYSLIIQFRIRTRNEFAQVIEKIDQSISHSRFQSYRIIETIDVFKLGGFPLNRSQIEKIIILAEHKWALLSLLEKNINYKKWSERFEGEFFSKEERQLLEKVNLSREYDTFINNNIIHRFTLKFNKPLPEFSHKFYIRIKPSRISYYPALANRLKKNPSIIDLFRTGEDLGLLAVVRTNGLQGFKMFLQDLYKDDMVFNTYTTVVIDEHLPTIYPPTRRVAEALLYKGKGEDSLYSS